MKKKFNVVIDTNIFIRSWFDNYEECDSILNLVENNKIKLLFSQESIGELIYITKKYSIKNMSSTIPRLKLLNKVVELFYLSNSVDTTDVICPSIKDPYDEMFLKCAIKGHADFLITDDYKSGMHRIQNINTKIVSSKDFMSIYYSKESVANI